MPLNAFSSILVISLALSGQTFADIENDISNWNIQTLVGNGIQSYGGDGGPAADAQLNSPYGMDFDREGNLFFVDYYNHCVRRVDTKSNIITTVVGTGEQGFSGDGGPARSALLNGPYGIAIDGNSMFIGDYFNQRIRVVNLKTGIIQTFAGTGIEGYSGDNGPALEARLTLPLDIKLGSDGYLYVSDYVNDVIRRIHLQTKVIEHVAGIGRRGFKGDGGPANKATLYDPYTMAVDKNGNIYISDFENHRIRMIDANSKIISTIAGNGKKGYGGDGGPATQAMLNGPYGIIFDKHGNLIFSDSDNDRVRAVNLDTGIIQTIIGTGEPGFGGDTGPASKAQLHGPYGLAIDKKNQIYVAEYFNHRIRRISQTPTEQTRAPAQSKPARIAKLANQIFGILPSTIQRPNFSDNSKIVQLGEMLFKDKRLSLSNKLSCNSCHDISEKYGTDGKKLAIGHEGQVGNFNSPTIFNAAIQSGLFHDGSASTVETQVKMVLLNKSEMANPNGNYLSVALRNIPEYRRIFRDAYPNAKEPIDFDNIANAIGAFERHLMTPGRFDNFMAGDLAAFSKKEVNGLELFMSKGCASCHRGPALGGIVLLTKTPLGRTSLPFLDALGREKKIKVPQLRNISKTGPYLHNGSHSSLDKAIGSQLKAYSYGWRPKRTAVRINPEELSKIIMFLTTLNGKPSINGSQ